MSLDLEGSAGRSGAIGQIGSNSHTRAPSGNQTNTPGLTIPTRRMSFEDAMASLPRHFAADGDLVASHIIAALSSVFPDGEDFFVRSVRPIGTRSPIPS